MSLSLGPNSRPRVCCHQNGSLQTTSAQSLSELSDLKHNSKIQQKMLNNEVPAECIDCFSLEKNGCSSPRKQYQDKFPNIDTVNPKIEYLDITIDNRCNLECIMCSPSYSHRLNSFFNKDLKTATSEKWELNLSTQELESLLPDLKMITLTGGEPFLSKKALAFISNISQSSFASQIELRLFTNFTILPENLKDQLKPFKSVELILSIDSIEDNYEIIRYPSKWLTVKNNITHFQRLGLTNTSLNIHAVIMANNWTQLSSLIHFYQEQQINTQSLLPIFVEIENPTYLHPTVLAKEEFDKGMMEILKLIQELNPMTIFQKQQIVNLEQLVNKIASRNFKHHYIDHKIYMNKIQKHQMEKTQNVL